MNLPTSLSAAQLEAVVREATEDMTPEYVAILRQLRPGMRMHQAFGLWRLAHDALYRQEMAKGLSAEDAMHSAAERLLRLGDD